MAHHWWAKPVLSFRVLNGQRVTRERVEWRGQVHPIIPYFSTTRTRVVEERYEESGDGVVRHTVKQSTKVIGELIFIVLFIVYLYLNNKINKSVVQRRRTAWWWTRNRRRGIPLRRREIERKELVRDRLIRLKPRRSRREFYCRPSRRDSSLFNLAITRWIWKWKDSK